MDARQALRTLERLRDQFGAQPAQTKRAALDVLARATLRSAGEVLRLHEMLCFMRAYPDDAGVLARVTRTLKRFAERRDLRAHRVTLANSGIAGTDTWYPFFWPTARWLATRWPAQVELDRDDTVAGERIACALPILVTPTEAAWLRGDKPAGFGALDVLRGTHATDGSFLLDRLEAMPGNTFTREQFHDAIEPSYVLRADAHTPNRTRAQYAAMPVIFQRGPLQRARPNLARAIQQPPRHVRAVNAREGAALVDMARTAMVSRERDLDAFAYGDARDVQIVEDSDGLAFMVNGVVPGRRTLLPAIFGAITLRNNVPIGYIQADVLGPTAALSFNTFPTFRGGEAAHTFGRLLAVLRHLYGVSSFSIEPYQLGEGNYEGIDSGAWWFYYKLGFRPRAREARRLVVRELERMRARPSYRSSADTLRQLARWHMFIDLDPSCRVGLPPIARIGHEIAQLLHGTSNASRADNEAACSEAALQITGLTSLAGFSSDERQAWQRWAPLVALNPQIARWPAKERRAVAQIIRAKGARSEREFINQWRAHPRFQQALLGPF